VALGGNLDDPPAQIRRALGALADLPTTRLVRRSSLYRNPPAGYRDQPDFVNAVAQIETQLQPLLFIEQVLSIVNVYFLV
jgi:2-amino-4-hydroxy-6-hydroxymethyldihydropteridine diphosphokinase